MSSYYVGNIPVGSNDIFHYGVLGMKWGVRRYQNKDGSLTSEGKKHYKAAKEIESANRRETAIGLAGVGNHNQKLISSWKPEYADVFKESLEASQELLDYERSFYENDKLFQKYANMAIDQYINSGYAEESDRESLMWSMKYDDASDGLFEEFYLRNNPKAKKEFSKLFERASKADKEKRRIVEQISERLLGENKDLLSSKVILGKTWDTGKKSWNNVYARYSDVVAREMERAAFNAPRFR